MKALRTLQHAMWYLCTLRYYGEPSWKKGDAQAVDLLRDLIRQRLGR